MSDANAKLDWAARHAQAMNDGFIEYARPGGGDERPIGIRFHTPLRPPGLVVAKFIIDAPMPQEISLLAADSVHNARTALDYVVARLKEHMGGSPGSGGFPVAATDEEWDERMKRSKPLKGLPQNARDFIRGEQPIHFKPAPAEDPLLVLHALDSDDKHVLLSPAFVYPDVVRAIDLIEIKDEGRVRSAFNVWSPGDPLEDGTTIARFRVEGEPSEVLGAKDVVQIGAATGSRSGARTSYIAMIDRVRGVVARAAALIDSL
jgi:hypothetical protein